MSNNTKKFKKFAKKQKQQPKKEIKKTKRSSFLYPAIEPCVNLKTRREEIEDVKSYFHKLSKEEKEWMNSFMEEENNANFNHSGVKLNKSKNDKKRIYNKNNARNRCIYTREKAQDKLTFIEKMEDLDKKIED